MKTTALVYKEDGKGIIRYTIIPFKYMQPSDHAAEIWQQFIFFLKRNLVINNFNVN